jgi:hypothetical protein
MTSIKTLCASALLIGTAFLSAPSAEAQGKGNKVYKAEVKAEQKEWKTERKIADKQRKQYIKYEKKNQKLAAARRRAALRTRVLCADGYWVTRTSNACYNRGGLALRQGSYYAVPRASARARERAALNSAVRRSAYSNLTANGAIARCMDGTYWHATTRTGACYRHGGVARWY